MLGRAWVRDPAPLLTMTADDRHQLIEELLRERSRYVHEGRDELVAEVDSELRRLGAATSTPRERATRLDTPDRTRL